MGSDEDTTDGGTGKGSAEQVAAIFRKSKKVIRTPTKDKEKSQEDKMDKILRMLGNLNNEMKEMREEQKEYRQEVRELRKENEKIKRENMELKQKIEEVEKKMDRMEKEKRRSNIIVQGIEMKTQDQNAIKEKLTSFLERALQIKIDIINAKKNQRGNVLSRAKK
jgi:predicted  nucleic acid-binding Zn-ribbon protein